MDKNHSITISAERKRGQHLGAEESGAIQRLKKPGYSNHFTAKEINCSPSTIGYELQRGTPEYCGRGRKPGYSEKRGVTAAMEQLHDMFGEQFSQVFQTITTDNESKFTNFSNFEKLGTQV